MEFLNNGTLGVEVNNRSSKPPLMETPLPLKLIIMTAERLFWTIWAIIIIVYLLGRWFINKNLR